MGDILLEAAVDISPPAIKVTNYSWSITPEGIVANLNYHAANGSIVKQEIFYIQGADFEPLKNALITSNVVGQKYIDVIERSIRNKVKSMKGWSGSVP